MKLQRLCHIHDSGDNISGSLIVHKLSDKSAVQLHFLEKIVLKIYHRPMSHAEIVHADFDAVSPDIFQFSGHLF